MKKLFIPVKDESELDTRGLVELVKGFSKIAVTSTTQFKHRVPEIAKLVRGFECPPVLGCSDFKTDAEAVIIITTGDFHAINIAVKTGKPVFILGPEGARRLDDKKIIDFKKKQAIRVSKVMDAKIIGVLVSTKQGQNKEQLGNKIVGELRSQGKQAYLFIANELSPLQLNDYPIDAWINTACPRLVEDEFDKPIINWDEQKTL